MRAKQSRHNRRVLRSLSAISDAALRRWIDRGFSTVVPLARSELARRDALARVRWPRIEVKS